MKIKTVAGILLAFMLFAGMVGEDAVQARPLYASGDYVWAVGIGGNSLNDDSGEAIAADSNGNVYSMGQFYSTVDFDPGTGVFELTASGSDTYLMKMDANGSLVWAKGLNYEARDMLLDANGNLYIAGIFGGTVDFDPGANTANLTSAGSVDIFVHKMDVNGNFLWAKRMGGTDIDVNAGVAVDGTGNVYTTGYFKGTADFDPGAGTSNLLAGSFNDVFVSKLDTNGNFIWVKQMGGADNEYGYDIAVDGSGNVYTTGTFVDTADFNPGAGNNSLTPVTTGFEDVFVSKLDTNGNFVWVRQMGGTSADSPAGIAVDAAGNVHTAGTFYGTANFDPIAGTVNLTAVGSVDTFISKLDTNGAFVWARQFGGLSSDAVQSVALDAAGNVYTTGFFYGTTDFDPGAGLFNLTSAGSNDVFVSRLDANGNFSWAKSMGGLNSDAGHAVAVDGDGNTLTTGEFETTADFDPGTGISDLTSLGGIDIFISKLDGPGDVLVNGGFNIFSKNLPKNWKAVKFTSSDGKTKTKKEGVGAVKIVGTGAAKSLSQTVNIGGFGGDALTFSYWVKGSSIPKNSKLCQGQVLFYNNSTKVGTKTIKCPAGTFNWKQKTLSIVAPANYTKIVVKIAYSKAAGTVYFDGVSLIK